MTKTKKEKISARKYINYLLMMVAVVLLCFIGSKLYNTYEVSKLKDSVLSRVVGTIQLEDIENTKIEMTADNFILISYVKSREVKDFETKLKKIIINNQLETSFYYLDATDLMLEDNYIDTLNDKFKLKDENKIVALPAILYYKEGTLVKTLTSTKDAIIKSDDFSKLLDNYEILEEK